MAGFLPVQLKSFGYTADTKRVALGASITVPGLKSCDDTPVVIDIDKFVFDESGVQAFELQAGGIKANLFGGVLSFEKLVAEADFSGGEDEWYVAAGGTIDISGKCSSKSGYKPSDKAIGVDEINVSYSSSDGYSFGIHGLAVKKPIPFGSIFFVDVNEVSFYKESSEYHLDIKGEAGVKFPAIVVSVGNIHVTSGGKVDFGTIQVSLPSFKKLKGEIGFNRSESGKLDYSQVKGSIAGDMPLVGFIELNVDFQENGWMIKATIGKIIKIGPVEVGKTKFWIRSGEGGSVGFGFSSDHVVVKATLTNGRFLFALDTSGPWLAIGGGGTLTALQAGFDFELIMGPGLFAASASCSVLIPIVPGVIDLTGVGAFLLIMTKPSFSMGMGVSANAKVFSLVTVGAVIAVGINLSMDGTGLDYRNRYVQTPAKLNGLYLYVCLGSAPRINLLAAAKDALPPGFAPEETNTTPEKTGMGTSFDFGVVTGGWDMTFQLAVLVNFKPAGLMLGMDGGFHAWLSFDLKLIGASLDINAILEGGLSVGFGQPFLFGLYIELTAEICVIVIGIPFCASAEVAAELLIKEKEPIKFEVVKFTIFGIAIGSGKKSKNEEESSEALPDIKLVFAGTLHAEDDWISRALKRASGDVDGDMVEIIYVHEGKEIALLEADISKESAGVYALHKTILNGAGLSEYCSKLKTLADISEDCAVKDLTGATKKIKAFLKKVFSNMDRDMRAGKIKLLYKENLGAIETRQLSVGESTI